MVSAGMSCGKYLLFCFNLIFGLSGIVCLVVGLTIHLLYGPMNAFLDDMYQSIPLIMMGIGAVVFVIAFFGCCGAIKENSCMIMTFSVLLLIMIVLELCIGVFGYIKKDKMETMLRLNLNRTMYHYSDNDELSNSWRMIQHEAECCGMNGPQDWEKTPYGHLPNTCCPNTANDGSCTLETPDLYKDGCLDKFIKFLGKYSPIILGIGIGIAVTQLVGVIFACCLARSIRTEYEIV